MNYCDIAQESSDVCRNIAARAAVGSGMDVRLLKVVTYGGDTPVIDVKPIRWHRAINSLTRVGRLVGCS